MHNDGDDLFEFELSLLSMFAQLCDSGGESTSRVDILANAFGYTGVAIATSTTAFNVVGAASVLYI